VLNPKIQEALESMYKAQLRELLAKGPVVSFDQSASVRCPIHGHHSHAYFVRPNQGGFTAQYVCGVCWKDILGSQSAAK